VDNRGDNGGHDRPQNFAEDVVVFLPCPARRALRKVQLAFTGVRLEIVRRGPIRTPIRAVLHADDGATPIHVLTSAELSTELRKRKEPGMDPLAALRMPAGAIADRIADVTRGKLRPALPDPLLRGLALSALVARAQVEVEEWEGREAEPVRLLQWLVKHGGDAALSGQERGWLESPVGSLPEEAWQADLPRQLGDVAYVLGLVGDPTAVDVPGLLHSFGILQDELPAALRS
jgi:hypothetical protein